MTDDSPFPVPDVPAGLPARDFGAAWTAGRTRRRRKLVAAGGTSGALLSVLAAGLLLTGNGLTGTSGLDELQPAVDASASPTSYPEPEPEPTSTPSEAAPAPDPGASSEPPAEEPAPSPDAAGDASPSSAASAERRTMTRRYRNPQPVVRDSNGVYNQGRNFCGIDAPGGADQEWCGDNGVSRSGNELVLQHHTCRADDGDQPQLSFPSSQEVELEVRTQDGDLVWRWSDRYDAHEDPHRLAADPGGCWFWTTTWNGETDDGRALPAGDYVLRSWTLADELRGQEPYESELTLPFAEPRPTPSE